MAPLPEPPLHQLLADPIMRLLLRSDRIEPDRLAELLVDAAQRLGPAPQRDGPAGAAAAAQPNSQRR
jgi:hypothetical protein